MRRYQRILLTVLAGCLLLASSGCIEPFTGSHVQFALDGVKPPCQVVLLNRTLFESMGFPVTKCELAGVTDPLQLEMDQRFILHYEMWATVHNSGAVHLLNFTVQRHLFPEELKAWEEEEFLRSNGKPLNLGGTSGKFYTKKRQPTMTDAERLIADQQMQKAFAKNVMTSFTTKNPPYGAGKILVEGFYAGNHNQLTLPHNGTYYGQVRATHPYGAVTLSGASVRVAPNLQDLDSMWITIEDKDPDRPNPQPGVVFLSGTAEQTVRGVINVKAASPIDPEASAKFGVMPNLGEEEYF